MTTVSIITPVHALAAPFVPEAYASLLAQTFTNWQWVIVLNGGGTLPDAIAADARVKVCQVDDDNAEHNLIGRLKGIACEQAAADVLVELDADDLLVPTALADVMAAFGDPAVAMVYSNSAEFQTDTWAPHAYDERFGWRSRPFFHGGHELREMVAWPASAHMMRQIFWAPNHIRAWRAAAYRALGGHDRSIKTGDDHDLCCRFYIAYGAAGVKHIDKCLYLYRLHGGNSCVINNAEVQAQTERNYLRYSRDMAARWAQDSGLAMVDLGGRFNAWPGFTTVDLLDADVLADLNGRWPFDDGSIGVIRAAHIFEHLRDPVHAMNEAFRVLAPGGWLLLEVPSTDGRGAFQDPTHVSFWNQNSIWYYTNRDFARFVPQFAGRFQASRVVTFFPSDFERIHNIPVVQADLIALKGDYARRPAGEVLI
jgi:SAM-dependent methyltransferase